jgi:O-antigen/teichoic acid export membrane protein
VEPAVDKAPTTPEVTGIARRGRSAIFQLTVRTGILRVVSLIGAVLLARILHPADFGAFAVVAFAVGSLAPIADLGMGAALVQQKDRPSDADIATVFSIQQVVWAVLLAITFVAAPLIYVVAPDLPQGADWMVRVVAVALWLGQMRSVAVAMMTRVLSFAPLATVDIVQQIVYVAVAVAVGLAGGGVWAFALAILAQYSIGTVLAFLAWGRLPRLGIERAALRRIFGFGLAFQASNLLHVAREAIIPLFGGLGGGVTAIGHLNFGQRISRLAIGLDDIVGRVAFPAFSRLQGDRERTSLALLHVVESTALVLSLGLGWAISVAPSLIVTVFSEKWAPAVPVFQFTALAALAFLPASFLRGVAFGAGITRPIVLWTVLSTVVAFVSFPFLIIAFGLAGGAFAFVLHSVIQFLGFAHASRHLTKFPWARLGRIYLLGAIGGVAAAVTDQLVGGIPGLVASGLVFVAVYGSLLLLFERDQVRRSVLLLRGRVRLEAAEPWQADQLRADS